MRRKKRTRKRTKIKTPSGKTVWRFKKRKVSRAVCSSCGAKLNRPRLNPLELRKISKVKRRPERPFPELCSKCMREVLKLKVRK